MTTPMPASGYPSNSSRTVEDEQTYFETMLSIIKEMPGGTSEAPSTQLASHVFTPPSTTGSGDPGSGNNACVYIMDTQSMAATDTLNNISTTNLRDGQWVILRSTNNARVITVANNAGGTGQIATADGHNIVMSSTQLFLALKYKTSISGFEEIFRTAINPIPVLCQGRLYGATGAPYGNVTAATSIYFGPDSRFGNQISLGLSSSVLSLQNYPIVEANLSLSGLTAGIPYDVYVYWNTTSQSVQIDTLVAWTGSGTFTPPTRVTGIDGRLYKNGDFTRLWVGAIIAATATTVNDNPGDRCISNVFNQIQKPLFAQLTANATTTSTTYTTIGANTTPGQGRARWIDALGTGLANVTFQSNCFSNAAGDVAVLGIGINSTTITTVEGFTNQNAASIQGAVTLPYSSVPGPGLNYAQMLVRVNAGTGTFSFGSTSGGTATGPLTYLTGSITC